MLIDKGSPKTVMPSSNDTPCFLRFASALFGSLKAVTHAHILRGTGNALRLHSEHLHHLVAQMVDDLYRNAAGLRFGEWTRSIAVERSPCFFVDLGFQRGLQRAVQIVCAKKIGVPDEETLFVVVGVDEPAGDTVGAV